MLTLAVRNGDYITIGPDILIKIYKNGEKYSVVIQTTNHNTINQANL